MILSPHPALLKRRFFPFIITMRILWLTYNHIILYTVEIPRLYIAAVRSIILFKEVLLLNFQDKTIVCKDCSEEFMFTASEQEFFAEKGFTNEPQRCKPCRDARKNAGGRGQREMFDVVCASCGADCKVPFQPRDDRPVYCSDCFSKNR